MRYFAAIGDVHGYTTRLLPFISRYEEKYGITIEFCLQVGDFEPHRDENDLETMAAPAKYRTTGEFYLFHQNLLQLPRPLYFIGGNHEPYGYLDQHPGGFQLIPNCHYIGRSGSVNLKGITVAGLSGIYKELLYSSPRPELSRIKTTSKKNYIAFNEADIEKLLTVEQCDILLLHEWPEGILTPEVMARFGFTYKASKGPAGNSYANMLIELLQPKLVLAGHMHNRFSTTLTLKNGFTTQFEALANIEQGKNGFALFSIDESGEIALFSES